MTAYWYSVEQVLQLPFAISIVSRYCVYRSVCFCFVSFVVNVNVKENFCDIFFVAFLARWSIRNVVPAVSVPLLFLPRV